MIRRSGFSLLEILLVVAIVALLAALLFPVLSQAKKSSYRAQCIENLRQIGTALAIYEGDFDKPPGSLDTLRATHALNAEAVTLCPVDPLEGYASRFQACSGKATRFPQTYETTLAWPDFRLEPLEAADPNHGVAACRVHGKPSEHYQLGMSRFCEHAWTMFEGTILRLRKDGSVQTAKLTLHRRSLSGGAVSEVTMSIWELFTDVPDPLLKGRR